MYVCVYVCVRVWYVYNFNRISQFNYTNIIEIKYIFCIIIVALTISIFCIFALT